MAITISAIFDSQDSADIARTRLHDSGIQYADCEVQMLAHDREPTFDGAPTMLFNPFMPLAGAPSADSLAAMPGNTQMFGGAAMPFGMMGIPGEEGGSDQRTSGEVRMRLRVRNDQAKLAEGVLVSCHGTKLRRG